MTDPIHVLGVHPSGALPHTPDPRDYSFHSPEVAQAVAPFDWNAGYDVERDISAILGSPFEFSTKNQGQSGSCGGQAFSYLGQAISAAYGRHISERSAKFLYSQVYVPVPGGGSSDRDLAIIAKNQGFGLEGDTVSYENGQPPDEAFMERIQDITPGARIGASKDHISLAYVFPSITLDTVAQALNAGKGIVLGLHGSNNGTWLTAHPKAPVAGEKLWAHYMYGGKARIDFNKKGIWCKQSWGQNVGDNGWQFLDEDYFASGSIWGAVTMLYNPVPTTLPQHVFAQDILLGQKGPEVSALQTFLAYDGEFNLAPTGYFGPITAQAVLNFQIKYKVADLATLEELGGDRVGPATRNALMSLVPKPKFA